MLIERVIIKQDNNKRTIATATRIVQNGDVRGIYHKSFLPNYSVFDEARYFSKGTQADTLFWYDDIAIGINICEDIWIENGPAEEQVKQGASLIININASPYDIQNETRKEIVMKKVKLNVPIIYLNMVGFKTNLCSMEVHLL